MDPSITVKDYDHYRVPEGILSADSYDIELKVYLDPKNQGENYPPTWCAECDNHAQHFDGKSKMHFEVKTATDLLVIHSRYLAFSDMKLKNQSGTDIAINMAESTDLEYIRIGTKDKLPVGTYTLETEYFGFLQPNNFGLYISSYEDDGQTHYIASTQMEGPYARRTFPCLDEPPYKATYRTTLVHQETYPWSNEKNNAYYALSNQEVKDGYPQTSDGWVTTQFEETIPMSTYLTAFAIVDFSSVDHESPLSNTKSELLARQQLIGNTRNMDPASVEIDNPIWFPRECTGRTTDRLGKALNLMYPDMGVLKADQIALPDFDAGAMENWGLVTYREQSLLFDMNRDRFRQVGQ